MFKVTVAAKAEDIVANMALAHLMYYYEECIASHKETVCGKQGIIASMRSVNRVFLYIYGILVYGTIVSNYGKHTHI